METEAAMETEPAPAFFLALRHGDTVTVRNMLSTAGAQTWIDYQSDLGYTPLYITALLNQPSITEQAARCNVDLQVQDGESALNIAAKNGHAGVTNQLIAARCNVHVQMEGGFTPLHRAAAKGHETVIKQLIAARCNVDVQAKDGYTPMHFAAAKGHESVTEQLIAARSNVDPQLPCGATPRS
jgi:cytohesin